LSYLRIKHVKYHGKEKPHYNTTSEQSEMS
jgi:hypothetical protein